MGTSDSDPNARYASFSFDDPDQFSLGEVLESHDVFLLDIGGTIKLTTDLSDQKPKVKVGVSITSHNIEIGETNFDKTADSLIIKTPKLGSRSFWRRPRLVVEVEIHIAKDAKLSNLDVSTRHLSIDIAANLSLAVADITKLSAVNGHVHCPIAPKSFTSREKYITTVSGGIKGQYTLEDALSVQTGSGGTRITVIPKPASKSDLAPSSFSARSVSGHIEANFETNNAPNRDYHVDVQAGSGGTSGTYIHGSQTHFTTQSGSLSIAVVPFDPSSPSELTTTHVSGSTDVRVLKPLNKAKDGTLGALKSDHRTVSGSLRLYYPSEWEGRFVGSSVSGHLIADGKGVKIDVKSDLPGMKQIEGSKGEDGMAVMNFHSVSGGAELHVG